MNEHRISLTGPVDLTTLDMIQDGILHCRARSLDLRLVIDSPGGDSAVALAAAQFLRGFRNEVTAEIRTALSAAAFIAMAASNRHMASNGFLLFHRATAVTAGNVTELRASAEKLADLDDALIELVTDATPLSAKRVLELMDTETWIDAYEALELGLVDELLPPVDPPPQQPPDDANRSRDAARLQVLGQAAEPIPFPDVPRHRAASMVASELAPCIAHEQRLEVPQEVSTDHIGAYVTLSGRRRSMLRLAHERATDHHRRGRRFKPQPATWTCSDCGSTNFHPPGDGLNPSPCYHCRDTGTTTEN